ncbi:hypothetical protein [Saccharopolyspora sp. SCSIO 74807]|uniref:hypothetical protein n=1 Tax=Saccharopolyspora sp. SCSIO 74807 TaxID=3118084 RepID=UPI0030CCC26C
MTSRFGKPSGSVRSLGWHAGQRLKIRALAGSVLVAVTSPKSPTRESLRRLVLPRRRSGRGAG